MVPHYAAKLDPVDHGTHAKFGDSLFPGPDIPIDPVYFGWGKSEISDGTFLVSLRAVRTDPVLQ